MAKRKSANKTPLPLANKQLFLQRSTQSLKRERVDVEEMQLSVYAQELSGRQLVICQERKNSIQAANPQGDLEFMALVVSLGIVDENGVAILTEEEAKTLIDGSIEVLKRLATKIMSLSGFAGLFEEVNSDLPNDQNSSSTAG